MQIRLVKRAKCNTVRSDFEIQAKRGQFSLKMVQYAVKSVSGSDQWSLSQMLPAWMDHWSNSHVTLFNISPHILQCKTCTKASNKKWRDRQWGEFQVYLVIVSATGRLSRTTTSFSAHHCGDRNENVPEFETTKLGKHQTQHKHYYARQKVLKF